MNLPSLQQIAPKAFAVGVLVVAVLAVDRLTHLPGSAPLAGGQGWTAAVGERLELTGPQGPGLLQIDTGAGDGVSLEAGPARLDGAPGGTARKLAWGVSGSTAAAGPGVPAGAGQDKVHVEITLDHPDPSHGRRDRTDRGFPAPGPGDQKSQDATPRPGRRAVRRCARHADHFSHPRRRHPQRVIQTGFTVLPGGSLKLTFPTYANGSASGMTILVGEEEDAGPRLWFDKAQIVAEGESHSPTSACAAPPAAISGRCFGASRRSFCPEIAPRRTPLPRAIWRSVPTVWRSSSSAGAIRVRRTRLVARWVTSAKGNPLLGILMGVVGAGLVTWVWNTLIGKKS